MRIVLVSPYSWTTPGGVVHHIGNLAQRLRERGHEVRIVAPADGEVDAGVIDVGRSMRVSYNGSVARLAFGPRVTARVRVALRRANADVIHVHEPFVPSASMIATMAARVPVVATFHTAAETSRAARVARTPLRAITRKILVKIAVSDEARKTAERTISGPMRIIPNGIDLDRFADVAPLDPGTETVVFYGRLEKRKGARVVCESFATIKRERPNARLIIVGEGPDRERCEEAIPPAMRSDVSFMGRVGDAALASVIGQAAVVALPALGGESFGIVLLEAMAAGRPVVATTIPGYAAVARDGVEALLVPPGDPRALAESLIRVMDDAALGERLAAAGKVRAAEFDWDNVVSSVEAAYEDALRAAQAGE
ncbi:MAG: glycosyltransferase family 4 protein [Actinomycetota bacterium]